MVDYLLGIDLGTTSCKASVLASDGCQWTVESKSYTTMYPHDGWVEQNPEHWWHSVRETVKKIIRMAGCRGEEIRSIGLTGQMHGLILLDKDDEVIRPAMLWSDHRASEQCKHILRLVPKIETITCNNVLPAFTLPKLLWIREQENSAYQRIHHILLPKDYIRYRLTGEFSTEPSDASGTSMYDVRNISWSPQILSALDVPQDWLPKCLPSTAVTGELTKSAANDLGLIPGIPVVGGGADQAAQAIAMGATSPGILGFTIGTSGVIVMTQPSPVQGSFCHAINQRWLQLNSMHSAGLALEWYRGCFQSGTSYDELESIARCAPDGSHNLLFMPFLLGERQSTKPSVPGSFIGITPQHDPSHLVRAIYEGVAFEFTRMIKNWLRLGMKVDEVRFSGGGSRSNLWQAIFANLLNLPVKTVEQGASFGAALLAGVGIGWWESVEQATETSLRISVIEEPTSSRTDVYGVLYDRYLAFYEILSGRT